MSDDNDWSLRGKHFLIFGVANRRSVAYHVGVRLSALGAKPVYVVHTEQRRQSVQRLLPESEIFVCDVTCDDQIEQLRAALEHRAYRFDGLLHSLAYATYSLPVRAFHETPRQEFLHAIDVSCFSLVRLSHYLKDLLLEKASVVTISISTTRMAAESYGYMGPIKAALDSCVVFLAKSFSRFSEVRFNAVGAGLLKTSSSAAIPGYVDAYLYAEQVIPRRRGLATQEVADVAVFLLSPRSSGINAQTIVVDAGMSINYFDQQLISKLLTAEASRTATASGPRRNVPSSDAPDPGTSS